MNRLKHFRVAQKLTQKQISSALGVSQPTYQRWESGSLPVPAERVEDIAQLLKTTTDALNGWARPQIAALYNGRTDPDVEYYGEVAIHFASGSRPLILSISERERERLYRRLESDIAFLPVTSLANDCVYVRCDAISEIYFSSDAYDDFGPDQGTPGYKPAPLNTMYDRFEWATIEEYFDESGSVQDSESKTKVDALLADYTEEELDRLVEEKGLSEDERKDALDRLEEARQSVREQAIYTWVQLSSGIRREYEQESEDAFSLSDFLEMFNEEDGFFGLGGFQQGEYHRDVLLNVKHVDYIRIPRHKVDAGVDDDLDKAMEQAAEVKPKAPIPALRKPRSSRRQSATGNVVKLPRSRTPAA